ncbi:MAG: hypothetical protein A4E57_01722 [Syntrophorhabdaceae bacterium PtaU1.Bin034]|nr:MAG: hypothetical protein A4E57_01722 [Syntrophorhabdaceae bacterium PtaU1.Bin034]
MKKSRIGRRDFLKAAAGFALGGLSFAPRGFAEDRSRVVLVRNAEVLLPTGEINAPVVRAMLDAAVQAVTSQKDPAAGWSRLVSKSDVVGVKSNAWQPLSTPRELEEAIVDRVTEVGVARENIAVDDRGAISNPVFKRATAFINIRPIRTHHWAGAGTCLKNYIMFVRLPWTYHPNACSDLGKIWTRDGRRQKTKLNILVALTPQFFGRGAHSFDRRYVWPYRGLIAGTDPVAVDTVGAELLRKKRIAFFGEDRDLDTQPIHIHAADKKYHLGVSDLSRIDLVRVGPMEDALL